LESPLRKINFNGHMENKTTRERKKVFDGAADDVDDADGVGVVVKTENENKHNFDKIMIIHAMGNFW
jgi:hypothetical protein